MDQKRFAASKKGVQMPAINGKAEKRSLVTGGLLILVITFLAYLPIFSNGFVNIDDNLYIEHQQLIMHFNLKALFSEYIMGNYHPLVMTVYSVIYHFFQIDPLPYHLVSLLVHLLNTALVLILMHSITGSLQVSFIVSLLFGIHPMHVESVAWASELKDLMYSLGFLASLIYYVRYIKEKQPLRLLIFSLCWFLFSLFSKGMGVSLTVVLFLLDFYFARKLTFKTVLEKMPFIVLSLVFGIIAIRAQHNIGAMENIAVYSLPERILFASYGFVSYIIQLFLPLKLSAFYPYPSASEAIPGVFYVYPVLLSMMLVLVFYSLRKTKKVFFGFGFYAVTVFLVLQLIPVGEQIKADRYSYLPSIGIFYLVAEGLLFLSGKNNQSRNVLKPVFVIAICLFSCFLFYNNYQRVKVWKDSMTLWNDVIENYPTAGPAYNNRGLMFAKKAEWDKAIADYTSSIQFNPGYCDAYNNRGIAYKEMGELDKAMDDYNTALTLKPQNSLALCNIGVVYCIRAMKEENRAHDLMIKSIEYLDKSIISDPFNSVAYSNRGTVFSFIDKSQEALNDYTKSIEIDPFFADSYYNRGILYYNLGKTDQACSDLARATKLGHKTAVNALEKLCN